MTDYIPPQNPSPAPGVLVLHAWWGLTPFFKSFCNRLSAEGFCVLAPDLFNGTTASTIAEAEELSATLKRAQAQTRLQAAAGQLRQLAGQEKIGLVGFSLGAFYGLWLTQVDPSIAAAVAFYGIRGGDYKTSHAAFQFHLAHPDPYVSESGIKSLEKALKTATRPAEFFHYHQAGHWFFEDNQPAFNATFAHQAWERTVCFLKTKLVSG